ncbi:Poly-beta-1,6-N-acetyl-D-glucosamine N-deacetylase precursor [Lacunisphaera limnophila]|uniref:Poly-beta-1,6-N-acetyl-D-glucosamine N-deacetylase n=1 Tax=Lacunisphaera limnophila TaxID=1838286 RepID=A0A1D8ARV6_9BACT|nr:poly-beta-1,6-N-acetyl-D-glucosamine N-deacetylase PgaB [Lacunisphaera limnophila]AOS43631.1 Poly-beta-1,6-N-acetyl-D-glucosamine N-deacetylase precursor [Lacunisphaera limnophila]
MAAFNLLRRAGAGLIIALLLGAAVQAGQPFTVLCYHDVEDEGSRQAADTITVRRLVEHFEWLKAEGYAVVSVEDVLAARAGVRPLPPRAVLLTFDDGYASFATRVLPLLEAYRYPAVFAFVSSWLEVPAGQEVDYGGTAVPRERFVTPDQLRRIAASPWVEIASHSHGLHRGLRANREGNELPAAIARSYDPDTGAREDRAAFTARVRTDLERSADSLATFTGRRPRVLVWPFGRYNEDGIAAARAAGYSVLFGLDPGAGDTDRLDRIPRYYPSRDPDAATMERMLRPPARSPLHRFARVDPAAIATAPTAAEQDARLGALIEATRGLGLTALHLDAFSDRDADGRPDTAFFAGSRFTAGPDYLNRLAWQTRTRAGVDVVLRLPLAGTDEAEWQALGAAVPFDGVLFTDFVSGRDDPARLVAALAVLRRYQPAARLHLRVPARPDEAGNWAALQPDLLWPDRAPGPRELAGWLELPAARSRLVLALDATEAAGADWLARGVAHYGLDGPPPANPPPGLRPALSARVDPFASP